MAQPNILGRALRYVWDAVDFAKAGRASDQAPQRYHPLLANILQSAAWSGQGESVDVDFYLTLAVNNPELYADVSIIADRIGDSYAFVVERVQPDGERVRIDDHPFLRMLKRPNSLMPGGLLLRDLAWWMSLQGNAYWFFVTDEVGRGPIREIWPLPARYMRPLVERGLRTSVITGEPIIDFEYTMGRQITLPGENVMHVRAPNLFDFWRGLSPLTALQDTLRTDANQRKWVGAYFGEGNALPSAVISVPPDTSDPDFEEIKESIRTEFAAQRRTAVTRAGDFDIQVIQHTIDEMKVYDGLGYLTSQVRRTMKVPDGLTGASSGQARLAAETALARDAIQPMLNYIAEWMTISAMPFYEEYEGELEVVAENIIPQDRALEATEYQAYGPERTLNENRGRQDLDPITLPPELAQYQTYLDDVPQRYVELFAQMSMAQAQAGMAAPGMAAPGMAGQGTPNDHQELVDQLTGRDAVAQLTGENRRPLIDEMTGEDRRPLIRELTTGAGDDNGVQVESGPRTSGLPTQDQLVAQLTGIKAAGLSADEVEALLGAAINRQIRQGGDAVDLLYLALSTVRAE